LGIDKADHGPILCDTIANDARPLEDFIATKGHGPPPSSPSTALDFHRYISKCSVLLSFLFGRISATPCQTGGKRGTLPN
jgi:hypothetical protein